MFEGMGNPFRGVKLPTEKKLLVLANGPSLKDVIPLIRDNMEKYQNYEYSVINEFANFDVFTIIRPKQYTLSDPMFFMDTIQKERGDRVIDSLKNKVSWDMYLYINSYWRKSDRIKYLMDNENIHIVFYHSFQYDGIPSIRNFLFKRGWANGEYSTVILNAIYANLMVGFRDVELYGVDHTFFEGLTVNNDNIPCYIYRHSFDDNCDLKPILFTSNFSKQYMDMPSYVWEKFDVFRGHKIMNDFANYIGATIVNCTRNSLIDAYPRKK